MRKLIEYKFIALVMIIFSANAFAQTPAAIEKIEKELLESYQKISANSAYSGHSEDLDGSLLQKANADFKEKLLKYTKIASTLKYKFTELEQEISIETSDDGKLRVYSWDRLDGGTMHFFETVYQFQSSDGKVSSKSRDLEEGDSGSFVHDIFTADSKSGKIYLVCTTSIGSTQDSFQNLRLLKVGKNDLNDSVKLIKTKSGLTDSIGFGYNFFSVVDREKRPVKLIIYDKKTVTFKIPVVIEDQKFPNGRVTDKFINYRFNGTNFVKVN